MNSNWLRSIIIYALVVIAAVSLFFWTTSNKDAPEVITISQAIEMSFEDKIKEIEIDGQMLLVTDTSDVVYKTFLGNYTGFFNVPWKDLDAFKYGFAEQSGFNWGSLLSTLIPLMLFGALIIFLIFFMRGSSGQAFNFGKSKAKMLSPDMPTITFDDVAGVEEAKQEVREVVEFLKSREKFQALGARVPKGILLVGAPGTGKTLLAKAVAGEASVPFYSISGSEFVEMFVGVGASRVRDLFEQAKRTAPAVIFIDEIDAVGRSRGAGVGGGHDEREQTLNQILVEMDGFDTKTNVIVIAATNRPDILDAALLRPGRFDRRIILDEPDINGRNAILRIHSKDKPLDADVDLESIGRQTVGFSGADLANLVNEAAILAARKDQKVIKFIDFEEAIDRVIAGPQRKNRRINTREKEVTAYHEVGHGLIARMLDHTDPVHKISIVARGMSLGHTRQLPTEDRYLMTRSQFRDTLAVLLGGYAAEQVIFNEISTGASDDIKRATELARKMVTQYGMSDKLGPRAYGKQEEAVFLGKEIHEQRNYGEKVADMIDDEVNRIMQEAYATAKDILSRNKDRMTTIASELYRKETLEGKALEDLFTREVSSEEAEQALSDMKERAKEDLVANERMIQEIAQSQKKEDQSVPLTHAEVSESKRKFPPKASLEAANEVAKRLEETKHENEK